MRKGYPRGHQRNIKGDKIAYRVVFNRANPEDSWLAQYLEPLRSKGEVTATIKAALHAYIEDDQKYSALVAQVNKLMAMVQSGELAIGKPEPFKPVRIDGFEKLQMPSYQDDDVIVIKRDKNAGATNADNFISSMFGTQEYEPEENTQTRPIAKGGSG